MLGLDVGRVLDMAPRKLREGVAGHEGAVLLHTETVLLRVASVENVVGSEEHEVQEDGVGKRVSDGSASGKLVLHHVDGSIAVSEGDTSHVPEDQHETFSRYMRR